jgi:DNA-binding PadR family transcriptional regulator
MKVPLYILGFLLRYGPQHGYRLKQHIEEEASDFAVIRTSNLYYHLEGLKKNGYVDSTVEREGKRPDRQVFEITEAGETYFLELLKKASKAYFKGEYLFDAILFFFEYLDKDAITRAIDDHIERCKQVVAHIKNHQRDVLSHIPEAFSKPAQAIFNHHIYHYQTELKWLEETLMSQKQE